MLNVKGTFMFPESQIFKGKWHRLLFEKKIYTASEYIFMLTLSYLLLKYLWICKENTVP